MTSDPESLRSSLLEARNLFRSDHHTAAYLAGRKLLKSAPEFVELRVFHEASAKTLNARMRQAARSEDHRAALSTAQALLGDEMFDTAARDTLLDIATRHLPPAEAIAVLLAACQNNLADSQFWQAISIRLEELPHGRDTIEVGFKVLAAMPGDPSILSLVLTQLTEITANAPADAAELGLRANRLLAQRITTQQTVDERRTVYTNVRNSILPPAAIGPESAVRLWQRLFVEQAIERAEGRLRPSKRAAPPDVWRFVDQSSPDFALRDGLDDSDTAQQLFTVTQRSRHRRRGPLAKAMGILSLWLQSTNREASRDRIGYLWLIADPLIHVLIICAIPVIIHRTQIMDMNVFPFGVIGACFWLVFRTAAIAAMSGGVLTPQLEHPIVRRFDIIIARAINAGVIYFFVGGTLLIVLIVTGQSGRPASLAMMMLCFGVNWLMGLSYGLIVNSLLQIYPGFRRINGFLMRLYGLTAGLFYVSELMSDRISQWLLWNPLLHTAQLGRTYWFPEYTSRDASWLYVLTCLSVISLFGLALLLRDERRVYGVRA